ncbi:MAG: hypothetical protein V4679_00735 [Pseudomonadota bacterium]
MLPYYTLEEVAEKSGLSRDQVIRLGFTGQLVFSIRKHTPQNYKEVEETQNSDGSRTVRTKTSENLVIVRSDGPALRLRYLAPEDAINIIANEAPNRKTLVRATYKTRDLDLKQGTLHAGSPIELAAADLIVCAEEWEIFSNGPGKHLRAQTPLLLPERVTLKWLANNLSITQWIGAMGAIASIFALGMYFAQTTAYQQLLAISKPVSIEMPAKTEPSFGPPATVEPAHPVPFNH